MAGEEEIRSESQTEFSGSPGPRRRGGRSGRGRRGRGRRPDRRSEPSSPELPLAAQVAGSSPAEEPECSFEEASTVAPESAEPKGQESFSEAEDTKPQFVPELEMEARPEEEPETDLAEEQEEAPPRPERTEREPRSFPKHSPSGRGERSSPRSAEPRAIQQAIEETNEIIKTLQAALDEMEELLETLELAERQKDADEHELEALRRALRQLQRPRDGGHRR